MTTITSPAANPILEADDRLKQKHLTLARVLLGIVLLAFIFLFAEFWPKAIILEVVLILLFGEILIGFLPKQITTAMKFNCIRQDGTWSKKREAIEKHSINKLRWNIRVILLMVITPSILLTWIIDREVFPINLGASAVASFQVPESEWKNNLRDEERKFDKWSKQKTWRARSAQYKRFLWVTWPIILSGLIVWCLGSWLVIRQLYLREIKVLIRGVKQRQGEYAHYDQGTSLEMQ